VHRAPAQSSTVEVGASAPGTAADASVGIARGSTPPLCWPARDSASRRSTTAFGSSASCTMILDTSTWSRKLCNDSTTRSARGCHPCPWVRGVTYVSGLDKKACVGEEGSCSNPPAVATSQLWRGTRFSNASSRLAAPKRKRRRVAETEGFEPSIGLYNPITV
jgi:hypothetical protein